MIPYWTSKIITNDVLMLSCLNKGEHTKTFFLYTIYIYCEIIEYRPFPKSPLFSNVCICNRKSVGKYETGICFELDPWFKSIMKTSEKVGEGRCVSFHLI